ncbi:MAG: ornithine cyclodeaminase family protein [Nitrososphaerota archaeon]|nr:ornithine cyclodeaminase family protein [Nitrososphaerota archaeon]
MRIISDEEARSVLSMSEAINAIESALVDYSNKISTVLPRAMIRAPNGLYRVMTASLPSKNVVGSKQGFRVSEQKGDKSSSYASEIVSLYDFHSGELLAIVKSHSIDEFRTAAAAAVGSKYLARRDSHIVGLFGSGLHAGPQIDGLASILGITKVKVFSRSSANREKFCANMGKRLGLDFMPVSTPADAVRDSDIIVEATTSATPVFDGRDLVPGIHVTSIGGGYGGMRQLDDETIRRANLLVVGSKQEILSEGSGDVLQPIASGARRWDEIVEIADIVSHKVEGRRLLSDITVYKSLGMGLYDVALANLVYEKVNS